MSCCVGEQSVRKPKGKALTETITEVSEYFKNVIKSLEFYLQGRWMVDWGRGYGATTPSHLGL
jgi:hypothetical protein